jgi:hypothetical protein
MASVVNCETIVLVTKTFYLPNCFAVKLFSNGLIRTQLLWIGVMGESKTTALFLGSFLFSQLKF